MSHNPSRHNPSSHNPSSHNPVSHSSTTGRALVSLTATIVSVGILACGRANDTGPPAPRSGQPPIVVVSIDTLRSDRLPIYGYDGVETPAIDALRSDSLLVERAYSHVPLTLPAHASLLSGRLPGEHGVRDNAGYRIGAELFWLPSLLADRGYATAAAISSFVLRSETGFARGFGVFDETLPTGSGDLASSQRPGAAALEGIRPWLRDHAGDPFFLFLHLYEPHTPYAPPEPFRSRYDDPYDGEIAEADRVVGLLIDELRSLGRYDDALIILLSDHGEGLGDHGEAEHGILLYREALQIPLLVKLPENRSAGDTIDVPSGLVDVVPTVLDVLGLDVTQSMDGRSLLGDSPPKAVFAETFYPRLHFGWSDLWSVVDGSLQFIGGPGPELYDVVEDPRQRTNLLEVRRSDSRRLAQVGDQLRAPLAAPAAEDPEVAARLESLGYLASANVAPSSLDPKEQIAAVAERDRAVELLRTGDALAAARILEELLAVNEGMVDGWDQLARSREALGQLDGALDAQRRALELSGGAAHHALSAGELLLSLGRLAEARQHAELARDLYPGPAYDLRARIAVASGSLDDALVESAKALEHRGQRLAPVRTRIDVLLLAGRASDAAALLDASAAALESEPLAGDWLLRSRVAMANGVAAQEVGEMVASGASDLRSQVAASPRDQELRTALTRLLLFAGARDEAREVMLGAVRGGVASVPLKHELAKMLADAGDLEQALELFSELADYGVLEYELDHARALMAAGRAGDAISRLRTSAATHPEDPRARETLATVLLRSGRAREAGAALEAALRDGVESAGIWNLAGVLAWQHGADGAAAMAAWQKALELRPDLHDARLNLGLVAASLGQTDLARSELERFVASAPPQRFAADLERARDALGQL